MFDLTSSKLLILGIVALLVVGPKDLPMLLRTIGKYVGIIRRHATEFRAQFDEAMRDTELDQIRKDVAAIKSDAEGALRDVTRTVDTHITDAKLEVEKAAQAIEPPTPEHATPEQPSTPLAASDAPAAIEPPAPIEVSALPPLEQPVPEPATSALNGAHAPTPASAAAKVEGQPT